MIEFLIYLLMGALAIYAVRETHPAGYPFQDAWWYWGLDILVWPVIVFATYITEIDG